MLNLSRGVAFLFLSLPLFLVRAENLPEVTINEIAWMGTRENNNNEWLELYNNTNSTINLEGWLLKSYDGTPEIKLSGEIPAYSFYLLERTDDNSVPGILADKIYTGALENSGEKLELFDNQKNLVDSVDCGSQWFAGDNTTKQTMEKIYSDDWQNSKEPGGTPKLKNSVLTAAETESKIESTRTYPSDIFINEILPSPEGRDDEEEWIEILNKNGFEVNLENWEISDSAGIVKSYIFPNGTKIQAHGYLLLSRPVSKITLNNDGDGLILYQPDRKAADSIEYTDAPRGESYNKIGEDWVWSNILTPGTSNIGPSELSEKDYATQTSTNKVVENKAGSRVQPKENLAAINQPLGENKDKASLISFTPGIIAVFISFLSGTIIFLLKKSLLKD